MSIAAKKIFTEDLTDRLSDKLTLSDINIVIETLTEQMGHYDIEWVNDGEGQHEFNEILAMYEKTKRIEGRSEKTIVRYKYILKKFREFDNTPIRQITVYNIRQFLSKEKDRGISDRTLEGYREIFTAFFGWAHREGLLPSNPTANLMQIKCKKEVRKPYSDVDLERLKWACVTKRDKAIVAFLASTGCRISEVCDLNREDVDIRNRECIVLGKGNKERTVYIDDVCAMRLQEYLDERKDRSKVLFVNRYNKRLTPGGIRARLHKIADQAGVQNVHPHRFRRTLATNLINHGMPIQELASILGHEKVDTTMKYVYIDKRRVKNSYEKFC